MTSLRPYFVFKKTLIFVFLIQQLVVRGPDTQEHFWWKQHSGGGGTKKRKKEHILLRDIMGSNSSTPRSSTEAGGDNLNQELPPPQVRYRNLRSSYRSKDKTRNAIEDVYNEDYEHIDAAQSQRLPPLVTKELRDNIEREAQRRCYATEKIMAQCAQDKMWTIWKCQKERDAYYACLHEKRADPTLMPSFRWKYVVGTFHGEIIGRTTLMKQIWQEQFPGRDLPHGWAE